MSFSGTPVLQDSRARLEPLEAHHVAELSEEIGDLWRTWYLTLPTPEGMPAEIDARLARHRSGTMAPWAIVNPVDGHIRDTVVYSILAGE